MMIYPGKTYTCCCFFCCLLSAVLFLLPFAPLQGGCPRTVYKKPCSRAAAYKKPCPKTKSLPVKKWKTVKAKGAKVKKKTYRKDEKPQINEPATYRRPEKVKRKEKEGMEKTEERIEFSPEKSLLAIHQQQLFLLKNRNSMSLEKYGEYAGRLKILTDELEKHFPVHTLPYGENCSKLHLLVRRLKRKGNESAFQNLSEEEILLEIHKRQLAALLSGKGNRSQTP